MRIKNRKLIALMVILIISINLTDYISNNPFNPIKDSEDKFKIEKELEDIMDYEDPFNPEDLHSSAPSSNLINFSLDALITEQWNETNVFVDINSTNPNTYTEWMNLSNTEGAEGDFWFAQISLINCTDYSNLNASDLTTMYFSYINESLELERFGAIADHALPTIYGNIGGHIKTNKTSNLNFIVENDWVENTNISFIALLFLTANRSYNQEITFIPTPENTESNIITWELNIKGHENGFGNQIYNGSIEIAELNKFTIDKVLGYDGHYWNPIYYSTDATHIYLNESCIDYKIELQTPNYITITYNDNITADNNELRLYTTCKMAGNLTIRFTDMYGNLTVENYTNVAKDEVIFFNYIMLPNYTGGIGTLNVTLINGSEIDFGVKFANILFYKTAVVSAGTQNFTTAFADFYIGAWYIDWEYLWWLQDQNVTYGLGLTWGQLFNSSIIKNATVTFEIQDIYGEMDIERIDIGGENVSLYFTVVELSEYLITPGKYNITFRASKLGYTSVESVVPIEIKKADVSIYLVTPPVALIIEEPFSMTLNFGTPGESFLRHPVNVSWEAIRNDTGLVDFNMTFYDIVQSLTIATPAMENTSIPGIYILNFSIVSEYYQGNYSFYVEILKKEIDPSIDKDFGATVFMGSNLTINWSIPGNRNFENMTLSADINGIFHKDYNATIAHNGITLIQLNNTLPGIYILNYTILSPFYNGTELIQFEILKKPVSPSLKFEDEIKVGDDLEIAWDLNGSYYYTNMSLEIYVDGNLEITINMTAEPAGNRVISLEKGIHQIKYRLVSPYYSYEETFRVDVEAKPKKETPEPSWIEENFMLIIIGVVIVVGAITAIALWLLLSRKRIQAEREMDSELVALKNKTGALEAEIDLMKTQLLQIAGIYWIIVIHSEQGVSLTEVTEFRFEELYGDQYTQLVGRGIPRDSALIGGFLTAIRNFSKETSDTGAHAPIFNSQTDYSTMIGDVEVHRRILEGTNYFMAFVSVKPTDKISDIVSTINVKFRDGYDSAVEAFRGNIDIFRPFSDEVVNYLHSQVTELEATLRDKLGILDKFNKNLNNLQKKMGIKKKKGPPSSYVG